MRIERKFNVLIETKRRFVIRQSSSVKQTFCSDCGEMMLTIEQAAGFLKISQISVFQFIETGAIHFVETEASSLMVCLHSLTNFIKENGSN